MVQNLSCEQHQLIVASCQTSIESLLTHSCENQFNGKVPRFHLNRLDLVFLTNSLSVNLLI